MENKIDLKYEDLLTDTSLKSLSEFSLYKSIEVTVNCTTYNHVGYIKKCLDGILMQRVNFGVQVLVHDDASTDGTTDIILEYAKKYPNIIIPIIEKENQYSKNKKIIQEKYLEKLKGKYIATCEGDDFWIDPFKLMTQYCLMESNPDCSLCVHAVKGVNARNNSIKRFPGFVLESCLISSKKFIKLINKKYSFQTSSYFRKSSDYIDYNLNKPSFANVLPTGDEATLLFSALKGKIIYINKEMSQYNMFTEGSWSSNYDKYSKAEIANWASRYIDGLRAFNVYSKFKYKKIIDNKIYRLQVYYFYEDDSFKDIFKKVGMRWFLIKHHPKKYLRCIKKYLLCKRGK